MWSLSNVFDSSKFLVSSAERGIDILKALLLLKVADSTRSRSCYDFSLLVFIGRRVLPHWLNLARWLKLVETGRLLSAIFPQ